MPLRSISNVWSHFSSSSLASGTRWAMPAFAMIASMPPYFFSAAATTALAVSVERTSSLWNSAFPPPRAISSATAAPSFSRTSVATTVYPAFAKALAVARPMPMPAPVMRTVLLTALHLRNWGRWSGRQIDSPARSRGKPPLRRPPRARQIARAAAPWPWRCANPRKAPARAGC